MKQFLYQLYSMPSLCRADGAEAAKWMHNPTLARLMAAVGMILLGGGVYGFALGCWRAPEMGFYVALKLPALLLLVCLCNGLLNGLLALVMGSGLGFRQTVLAMLMSFAIFSMIVGSLGSMTILLALTIPGPQAVGAEAAYALNMVINVVLMAFAGVISHRRFFPGLAAATPQRSIAVRVFCAWLLGNLFVGAQLSWNLRPFFGHPSTEPALIRDNWREGNFYETLAAHAAALANSFPFKDD
jgi:hypothetical protein